VSTAEFNRSLEAAHAGDGSDSAASERRLSFGERVERFISRLSTRNNFWHKACSLIWGEAVKRLRDAGVAIESGMMAMIGEDYSTLESIKRTGGVRPDSTWERNRAHADAVADLAAAHEIDLVTFHAGFLPESPDDPERQRMLDRLWSIGRIFDAKGRRLGLETGQETAKTLLGVLDELQSMGCDNIGVNLDPANMLLYGTGDPVKALVKLIGRVVQVHIKDAVPGEAPGQWGSELAVNRGAVDWGAFLEVLRKADRAIPMAIEREAGDARVEDVRLAVRVLKAQWEGD
jgi:sugar phosphate isomerase/epimerase